FNNFLTIILSYAEFIRARLATEDEALADLDAIRDAGQRAARLTAQLLTFSRRQVQEREIVDVNATVAELVRMLERTLGDEIQLGAELGPEVGRVYMDPT